MILFVLQFFVAMASDWKPSFQLMPESAWQPPAGNFSIGTSFMRFAPTDRVSFSAVPFFIFRLPLKTFLLPLMEVLKFVS